MAALLTPGSGIDKDDESIKFVDFFFLILKSDFSKIFSFYLQIFFGESKNEFSSMPGRIIKCMIVGNLKPQVLLL